MTNLYPDHPNLRGNYAPLRMECNIQDLIIEGEVPRDLFGSYYRNGPDPQFPPMGGDYHWFAGDGMIHAFHFENGRISYLNRWAQTSKWKQERKAGRSLINALNPMDPDPEFNFEGEDGTANTNIVFHSGKLLALEEGHKPFELDPLTLESKGAWNYKGKLDSAMTAHPKIDPKTGEMIGFSYGFGVNKMSYFVVNSEGIMTTYKEFKTPYSSMVHDFVVTTKHIIFPILLTPLYKYYFWSSFHCIFNSNTYEKKLFEILHGHRKSSLEYLLCVIKQYCRYPTSSFSCKLSFDTYYESIRCLVGYLLMKT